MKNLRIILVATAVAAVPSPSWSQEIASPITSPPILLLPIESSVSRAATVFLYQGNEPAVAAGLSYSQPLTRRLAVQAQAAASRRSSAGDPLAQPEGLYAAGHLGASFALEQSEASSLRLFGGVQADHRDALGATRLSFPVGVTLALTTRISAIELSPIGSIGAALRHDDANSNREIAGPLNAVSVERSGWFAQMGLRLGVGAFWGQADWGRDKQLDADARAMPPLPIVDGQGPPEIRATPRWSLRFGYNL
ncbi:MAG TPA: hypothetical protein VFQ38_21065 [Longimicrobiales bacterium]|nr:hypothetical protein [Longimicrobiales bacterium]